MVNNSCSTSDSRRVIHGNNSLISHINEIIKDRLWLLWRTEHISGHLWHHVYCVMVNLVMTRTSPQNTELFFIKNCLKFPCKFRSELWYVLNSDTRLSWSWSYGSCIYNYPWNQYRSWRSVLDTTLLDKVCQWLAAGRWFSPCTPVSSTNKTARHDITEIHDQWFFLRDKDNSIKSGVVKLVLW